MKMPAFSHACVTLAAAALTVSLVAQAAAARDLHRSGTYLTGKGRTGSYNSAVTGNRRTGLSRSQSITTNSGRTFSRSATSTYDPVSQGFGKTVTGAGGNTRTYTGTAASGQANGTYSTSNGASGTFTATATRNDENSVTRSGTWTNQDGQTYNRGVTSSYDRAAHTLSRDVTGPQGNTRQGSVTFTPSQN